MNITTRGRTWAVTALGAATLASLTACGTDTPSLRANAEHRVALANAGDFATLNSERQPACRVTTAVLADYASFWAGTVVQIDAVHDNGDGTGWVALTATKPSGEELSDVTSYIDVNGTWFPEEC